MKNIIFLWTLLILGSCSVQNLPSDAQTEIKTNKASVDDEKWEVIVFDPEYETYMRSIARPMTMFTDSYLSSRNQILVSEWNSRYLTRKNPDFYEVSIDYNPSENYGLEFNYRLYHFFGFLNWKYGVKFNGLGFIDRRK